MPAFPIIFKPSPVLAGGNADQLSENAGVIVGIIKAYVKSNVPDRDIRFYQKVFGGLNAYLVDIGIDIYLNPPFKNMA